MQLEYHTTVETDSPIINAALAMATEGHDGQKRGKIDREMPYIVHPVMVYELLRELGVTDELTLSAALLHDVKEDNERYQEHPEQFVTDLEGKLANHGVRDARQIAHCLDNICEELKNAEEMLEGKRLWQQEHAVHLSPRAAEIKLVDQMASMLDFIMMPNEPGFTNKQVEGWSFKALNLVKTIANDRPELNLWRNLTKALFSYSMNICSAGSPEAEAEIRGVFNWDTAMKAAKNMPPSQDAPAKETVWRRESNNVTQGLISVTLAENGGVMGYSCLADPTAPGKDPINQTAIELMNQMESAKSARRVTSKALEVHEGRLVRSYKVKPPIAIEDFNGMAQKAGAIDNAYALALRDTARKIDAEQQRAV